MNNLNLNEIIKLSSTPKIIEQLDILGEYIDNGLENIKNISCSEENKQEVKKYRAEINEMLKVLEDKRKEIKKQILEPYDLFNNKFEQVAKNKLQNASQMLNDKISYIETQQKADKEQELREFANEHFIDKGIQDLVTFEKIGLNITLSASMKSLKDQIIIFCEKVADDLDVILLEDMKDEIYVEYKKSLNYTEAKKKVLERQIEIKNAQIATQQIEETKESEEVIVQNVQAVTPIKVSVDNTYEICEKVADDLLEVSFTVVASKDKILKIKEFLTQEKIEWR